MFSSPSPHPTLAMAPPHTEHCWRPAVAAEADQWHPYSNHLRTSSRWIYLVLKERQSPQQNPTADFLFSAPVTRCFKLSPRVWVSPVAAMIHPLRMSNARAASWHQASPSPVKLLQLLDDLRCLFFLFLWNAQQIFGVKLLFNSLKCCKWSGTEVQI